MNKRIRKKKEKQSILEHSFEIIPEYPFKERKKAVDKIWQISNIIKTPIKIGYKRRKI